MSGTAQLTLQTIQDNIHTQYTNANDTPAVGSSDWIIRMNLINSAIAYWAAQRGVEWNELWTTGNTTPSVITLSTTSYAMPTDFNYMGGYIRLVLTNGQKAPIEVIKASDAQQYINQSVNKAYITGKPGSYILKLLWTPSATDPYLGATIEFDYYKYPLLLTSASEVPEMSNPWYIVHYVTAKLFQTQSPTNYNIHNNLSIDMMSQMMEGNQMTGLYSGNYGINFQIGG